MSALDIHSTIGHRRISPPLRPTILSVILLLFALTSTAKAALLSITLKPNIAASLTPQGFKFYWDTVSRNYDREYRFNTYAAYQDCSHNDPLTVSCSFDLPFVSGNTYYFAATNYNGPSIESDFSAEVEILFNQTDTPDPTNMAPIAVAGPIQSILAPAPVTLDGSGSLDPEEEALSWRWTQTSGPDGGVITNPTWPIASFTPPLLPTGTTFFSFLLQVKDLVGLTDEDSADVWYTIEPPVNSSPVGNPAFTADFDHNGIVDGADLALFANLYMEPPESKTIAAFALSFGTLESSGNDPAVTNPAFTSDSDNDCDVDGADLALFAHQYTESPDILALMEFALSFGTLESSGNDPAVTNPTLTSDYDHDGNVDGVDLTLFANQQKISADILALKEFALSFGVQ